MLSNGPAGAAPLRAEAGPLDSPQCGERHYKVTDDLSRYNHFDTSITPTAYMCMSIPKNHHYVPQWLSKRWISIPEKSEVYGLTKDRNGRVKHSWKATPKAVCWEKHEYTINDNNGEKDATLESEFYSKMDDRLNDATEEIIVLIEQGIIPKISEETRKGLAHSLVIDLGRRNPDQKEVTLEAAQRSDFKAAILHRIPDRFSDEDAEKMYDELTADVSHMKLTTNKSRRSLLEKGVGSLTAKPFRYVLAPKGKTFILGNPLVLPKDVFVVPIDPKVAIVFRSDDGPRIGTLTNESIRKVNESTYRDSSRVIATCPKLLKSLAKQNRMALSFSSKSDKPEQAGKLK